MRLPPKNMYLLLYLNAPSKQCLLTVFVTQKKLDNRTKEWYNLNILISLNISLAKLSRGC